MAEFGGSLVDRAGASRPGMPGWTPEDEIELEEFRKRSQDVEILDA